MSEKENISNLCGVSMDKLREMVDVETIIGDPIHLDDNITAIPVSKVTYGFASGGSDLPAKSNPKDLFGGGTGGGVTIQPVAFLVVQDGNVKIMSIETPTDVLSSTLQALPDLIHKVSAFFPKTEKSDGAPKK